MTERFNISPTMPTALRLLSLSLVFCVAALAGAQVQHSPDVMSIDANAAYDAKNWTKAEPLYAQLVAAHPESGRYWYRLGICRQRNGQHEKAVEAFQKAQAAGMPPAMAAYNLAAAYATLGEADKAIAQLTEAVKQGYAQPEDMSANPDLQSVRQDARFSALLEGARKNLAPCTYTAENRQFDFWVGDWDVVTTKENTSAGTSHIEKTIGDCVIWENWTSLGTGYTGKSYNIYNASLKRWEQFWVDNAGGMIHFYGALQNNVMDFYTDEMPQDDGTKLKRHLQFFNLGPDRVRQFSQGSTDGGATWSVEYDFTYNRHK
jgi:tetratricopeptide (TPR) repeat protein